MIKIPTMFKRNESVKGHPVIDVITPGCEWVALGEGIATVKFDGTNVKVEDRQIFKRQRPPAGVYDYCSYVPCDRMEKSDDWAFQAFDGLVDINGEPANWPDGIYELIGPKVQGNPYGLARHTLVRVVPHSPAVDIAPIASPPRDFAGLRTYLAAVPWEGIVFHHDDGRMAKIKRRDFGIEWPIKGAIGGGLQQGISRRLLPREQGAY